jgi:hypothetical protein
MSKKQQGQNELPTMSLNSGVQEKLTSIIDAIPENSGTGYESVINSILNAKTVTDFNSTWQANSMDAIDGREICITRISKVNSDYDGGLGFFLICDYFDYEAQKYCVGSTGSISICVQLAKANAEGWLPLMCMVVKSEKPTKDGFYPLHLQVLPKKFKPDGSVDYGLPD